MRWEAAYYVLWTRKAVLTKEERRKQTMKEEQDALARELPRVGDTQPLLSCAPRSWRRAMQAFVAGRVVSRRCATLTSPAAELDAHASLKIIPRGPSIAETGRLAVAHRR